MVLAAIATIAIIKSSSSSEQPKPKPSAATTIQPIKGNAAKPNDAKDNKVVVADVPKQPDDPKKLDDKKLDAKKLDDQKKLEAKRLEDQRKAEEAKQRKLEEQQRRAEEAKKKKAERTARNQRVRPNPQVAIRDTTTANTSSSRKPPADTSDVKNKAEQLYRSKKFNDAAKTLRAASESLGEADARDLRSVAAVYEQVGKAYNVGMGPATPPVEAYTSLERALNLDRPIGVFSDEIKSKLAAVAPKAAAKFMADKNYEAAFKAVRVAETNGGGNSTTQAVRSSLIDAANELYSAAMADKDSNPSAARAKLQRIKGMVDGKTPVVVKAEKALRDLPK